MIIKKLVVLLTKYPEPGKVKTRLAKDIGFEKSAQIQEMFIKNILKNNYFYTSREYDFKICLKEGKKLNNFVNKFGTNKGDVFFPEGDDLGNVMKSIFIQTIGKYDKVILIGSDIPLLNNMEFEKAFQILESKNFVFGKALDGGYYNDLLNISKNIELIIVYKGLKYNYLSENLSNLGLDIKLIEVKGESTRSIFMNIGAKQSSGDILLFLHNDTILPISYFELLSILDLSKYNYGGFYKQFYPNNLLLAINSTFTNIRLRLFGSLLGDNSIFVSNNLFTEIGGFPDLSLMEDVELSKKLRKYGKIHIIKNKTITSSKKFIKNGTIKTLIYMIYLRFLYLLGLDSKLLKEKYSKF